MSSKRWKMVGRPEPPGSGQRFFLKAPEENPNRAYWLSGLSTAAQKQVEADALKTEPIYICDNSGEHPEESDDGPLRWDRSTSITMDRFLDNERILGEVAVIAERRSERFRCGVTVKEAIWLVEYAGAEVVFTEAIAPFAAAVAKLWAKRLA